MTLLATDPNARKRCPTVGTSHGPVREARQVLATDLSPLSARKEVSSASPSALPRPSDRLSKGVGTLNRPPRGVYLPQGVITNVRFGGTAPVGSGRTAAQ